MFNKKISKIKRKSKSVCMIAYTNYLTDARVRREAETLASCKGYEVTFLALKETKYAKSSMVDGVNVVELNIKKYRGKSNLRYVFSYLTFTLIAFAKCIHLLLARKCDVVHVHNMPNFLVFAALPAKFCGKKILLDIHDSMPETYSAKFNCDAKSFLFKCLAWEERFWSSLVDKVICVNHIQKEALLDRGISPGKIEVSMNVPDHKVFKDTLCVSEKNKSEYFKMVYHGTVTKRLGVDVAIKAFARANEETDNLQFYIYGTGDDVEEFLALITDLGLEEKVFINNEMLPLTELIPLLKEMSLGIIANRKNIATELMLPVKMIEYIALGIPVIAPELRTIEYYFSEEMVSFFPPEDINSLAAAIIEIYRDKSKRKKQAEKSREFLERYGWEKHQFDLINLYNTF